MEITEKPNINKIVANSVRRFSTPLLEITNCAMGALEVVPRYQNNKLLINLANYNGDMTRPMEKAETLIDIHMKIFVPQKYSTAKGLVSRQNFKLVWFEKGYMLTIPKVERHEIVVME